MLVDRYGNPASTNSQAALAKYDEALELIRLYKGDPIALLDGALADDPDFGGAWATRAGFIAQSTDRAYAEEIERSVRAGAAANLNDRERAHLVAANAWAQGNYRQCATSYARIAQDNPRDLLAVQYAHLGCFFLGMQSELRDWPLQAMRAFKSDDDGFGALLGMVAFGLEECGDYARAESFGRQAVEIDPRDSWAVHAVAHVNEMRGDVDQGVHWITSTADQWTPESGFAYHNWWHLGLLHLDRDEPLEALKLYDEKVRPNDEAQVIQEWIDASALLWRLHLDGVDTGHRFAKLAKVWERTIEDGYYAFNDLHAIMAYIGAGRMADAERALQSLHKTAQAQNANGAMSASVGVPLAEAFIAFAKRDYFACVEKILAVRGIAQRFGGSHAQRDILSLTALHAAKRGGMKQTAQALASERTALKPNSLWAKRLAKLAA